jgi:hypothetical protein
MKEHDMPLIKTTRTLRGELEGSRVDLVYTTYGREPSTTGSIEPDYIPAATLTFAHKEIDDSFEGVQIVETDTPIGALVTVRLWTVPDLGSTDFSFLIPAVAVTTVARTPIHTIGLQTFTKQLLSPNVEVGQSTTFASIYLHGAAESS